MLTVIWTTALKLITAVRTNDKITVPFNPIFKPVHQCKKRYVVMKGSAGSGKSVDTAQLYILRLMRDKGVIWYVCESPI